MSTFAFRNESPPPATPLLVPSTTQAFSEVVETARSVSSAFLSLASPHSAVSVTLLPGTVYNVAAGWSDSPSVHPMNSQSPPIESVPSDGSAICSPSLADIGAGTLPAVAPPPANDTVHVFMSHFATR